MKATLILSLLLLLTLVRSQSLFEEKFLLGSSKKDKENKEHKSDYKKILKEESPIYSNNKQFLAKIHKGGDLALYGIKNEGESHQILLWSTELSKESKGFKRNLYVSKNGVLKLRKDKSSKALWSSKCKVEEHEEHEEQSEYKLIVTDEGRLCLIGDSEDPIWCNGYEVDYCEY